MYRVLEESPWRPLEQHTSAVLRKYKRYKEIQDTKIQEVDSTLFARLSMK